MPVHCQLLAGKFAINVATSGGPCQERQVTTYLSRIMLNFGCFVTGSVGSAIALGPEVLKKAQEKALRLGETLSEDMQSARK